MASPSSIMVTSFDSREASGANSANKRLTMGDTLPSSGSSNCLPVVVPSETEPIAAAGAVRCASSMAALPSEQIASPIYRMLVVSRRPSAISLERHGSFALFDDSMRDWDDGDEYDDDSVDDEHFLNGIGLDLDLEDDDGDGDGHADNSVISGEMRSALRRVSSDVAMMRSCPELSIDGSGSSSKSSEKRRSTPDVSRLCAMVPDVIRIEDDVIQKAIRAGKLKRTTSQASVGGSKIRRNVSFSVVREDRAEHVLDAESSKEEDVTFDVEPTCKDEAPADAAPFSPFGSLPPISKKKCVAENI